MSTKKIVQNKIELLDEVKDLTTTSAKIRYLSAKGLSRGDISRVLDIRYQWVRNVLIQPLKK